MASSRAHKILWFAGIVLVILPHVNLGLLSDYKICGDSECESLMSRVQAIRDHRGKDCRFLSFRRGDTIFVYHKLTGKREDLWAGTIDRQFGYFPKDTVQEEQVYATTEKVVETQKSDFICMDKYGYPIDSSHLDNSYEDGDNDQKIENSDSETIQPIVHTDETSAESPSTSIHPLSDSLPDDASREEDEKKNSSDTAATTHEEAHVTPAAPNEQGGSPSSSWLGSSVTGWLGLGKREQPGNLAEEEKKDKTEEVLEAEASLTSSVTGWLGFGGEGKPDDTVSNREEDMETAASFTSTMTGWLGFGGKKETDSEKKELHDETEIDDKSEPKETFRSRRISLDLEGSHLQEEEKDMGTLDWLGNGLSNTLGFKVINRDSEPSKEEKEKSASTSWLNIGVGDILGLGKYTNEGDEITKTYLRETKKDETLEQSTASNNADISQSQPIQAERTQTERDIQKPEEKIVMETIPEGEDSDISSSSSKDTNKSNVKEHYPFSQSETESATFAPGDFINDNMDASDSRMGNILSVDDAARIHQRDMSPQTMLEENPQALGGTSSMIDEKPFAEAEDKGHQKLRSTGSGGENNNRDSREEEIKTGDNNMDFLTQSDTDLGSDLYSIASKRQSVLNIKGGNKGRQDGRTAANLDEEGVKTINEVDNKEESTVVSLDHGANNDSHKREKSKEERNAPHTDIYTASTDQSGEQSQEEERRGKSQSSLSSDTTKEENEPTHGEDYSVTTHIVKNDNLNTVAMIDDSNIEREQQHIGVVQDGESHSFTTNTSGLSHFENASKDQTLTQDVIENSNSGSLEDKEVEALKETAKREELKEVEVVKEGERQQKVVEGKQKEEERKEAAMQVYGSQKKEKHENVEKFKEDGKHHEIEEAKEKQEVKELAEEVKGGDEDTVEVKEPKEEEKQDKTEEKVRVKEKQEVKELKEEEKGEDEDMVEVKEEEKEERLDEVEKEEEKHDELEKLVEEEKEGELGDVKEEEKQEKTKDLQLGKKQVEEFEEEKKQEEVEKQQDITVLKEEEKQAEVGEINGQKKQEEVQKPKKEEIQENVDDCLKEKSEEKQIEAPYLKAQRKDTDDISKSESESSEIETDDEHAQTIEEMKEDIQVKHENVDESKEEKMEVDEVQQVNDVEGKRRDKEEQECLKSPGKPEDDPVVDRNENISEQAPSAADKSRIQQRKQNVPILESDTIPSEGMERDRLGEEEKEKTSSDSEADEGEKSLTLNSTGNEDIYSHKFNMSSPNGLKVEQIGATSHTDNDQQLADESEHSKSQTEEAKEDDDLARKIDLPDPNMFSEGPERLMTEDGETSINSISSDQINFGRNIESQEQGVLHVSQDPVGPSVSSGDPNRVKVDIESGGAFGLFNAFSFLSQTPVTKTKESTESTPGLDRNTAETSQPHPPLIPEQESDSIPHSCQVPVQELRKDAAVSIEALPSMEDQSCLYTPSPSAESPVQTKPFSKYYKTLLSHVSGDELTILVDLFGRNKLQFLDDILVSTETVTDDPDHDESILSDIERLLHHQMETLVSPSVSLSHAPQEDKEKTKTLIALQKLKMLLEKMRATFNTRKGDVSKANRKADASCVGASCSTRSNNFEESKKTQDSSVAQDTSTQSEWKAAGRSNGQSAALTDKARETEVWKRRQKGVDTHTHIQQGPLQPLEGVMKPILDFVHQITKDSITHIHAATELVIWITVKLSSWLNSVRITRIPLCRCVLHTVSQLAIIDCHKGKYFQTFFKGPVNLRFQMDDNKANSVVSSLPDDIRPGPDLYGLPWEPVIVSSLVGLVTVLLFICRCYSSVKSRMYRSKEHWMAEQITQLLDEKCKVLETLSKCQQEYDDLEDSLRDSGVLAQSQKTEQLNIKARQVKHAKRELERDIEQLKDQLEQQKEHRIEQERRITVLEESTKTLEDETKDLQSQEEQAQTTLKVYSMNSDRLQRNLEMAAEESTLLQESNAQLRQQAEGWAERVSELEAEIRRCELACGGMQQDVANKDERIMSLTDHLLKMKAWDSDLEDDEREEGGKKETSNGTAGKPESEIRTITDTQGHLQKVQKLIYAAKLNANLKSLDEDKDRVFAKLNDEVKAKEDLQESIKELENEKISLQSDAEHDSDQIQRLQQKLQIMTEMYQENELKLHRLLTVEERERLQKEEKLNKADKNIALAIEEVSNYRQRAEEMEEELEKTKQSYQTQISAHEKKAHNNWLAARAAERELADIRRENALFRQKLTDTQFKLDAIDKDPYALDSLARPLPFRAERSPYGPSPLGRPASETRAFLSPPTLMDGPPARVSPRMSRGPVEPPAGQGELERSRGPHSDSGSISPTWERDRRGPPPGPLGPPGSIGPPGYMFPEPGGPMYRRPLPPQGAIGILPPPGSLLPGPLPPHPRGFPTTGPPHPINIADGPYRENSIGPVEQQHRESGPGDRRTPPEGDIRMGGPLHPGPPMGPMDGLFPCRSPYGPPPPDFYPPRGPGGPPMRPMWATPSSGMMLPPRFSPSGPLPSASHPHYTPAMRPPGPDGVPLPSMGPPPPQQSLPSPQHSQSPEEHTTSPEDAI